MSHIFVSYSRIDIVSVDQIVDFLNQNNVPIWIDRMGIAGGDQWRRQIVHAIEQCDAFLLVLSNSAVISDNVRKEIDLAEQFGKRIIPVEIETTRIPPELSYQLVGIQRIDLTGKINQKIENLSLVTNAYRLPDPVPEQGLDTQSDVPTDTAPIVRPHDLHQAPSPESPSLKKKIPWIWIGSAVGLLFLIVIIIGALSLGPDPTETAGIVTQTEAGSSIAIVEDMDSGNEPATQTAEQASVQLTDTAIRELSLAATEGAEQTEASIQQTETSVQMAAQVKANATATAKAAQATQDARQSATEQAARDKLQTANSWPLVLSDTFTDNTNDWAVGDKEGDYAKISWSLGNGKYIWDAYAKQGFVWWVYPDMDEVSDLLASVDVQLINGPSEAESGIVFRLGDGDNYYLFEIDNKGRYALYGIEAGEWDTIRVWTKSPAVRVGTKNQLTVMAEGPTLSLFINDLLVAEVNDTRFSGGKVGLLVSMSEEGDTGKWEFSDFELRSP